MSELRELARFISQLNLDHVPKEVQDVAKLCVLDSIGVALGAKFSSPFTVACAFIFGEVTLNQFKQKNIDNSEVKDLLSRVTVVPDDKYTNLYPDHWGCELRVNCKDGRILTKDIKDASGSVDNPLTNEQVKSKALALIKDTCPEDALHIVDIVLAIDRAQTIPSI